jgi:hypothetical protein
MLAEKLTGKSWQIGRICPCFGHLSVLKTIKTLLLLMKIMIVKFIECLLYCWAHGEVMYYLQFSQKFFRVNILSILQMRRLHCRGRLSGSMATT